MHECYSVIALGVEVRICAGNRTKYPKRILPSWKLMPLREFAGALLRFVGQNEGAGRASADE